MTDLSGAVFTEHARREMQRRGLAEKDVTDALAKPDSVRPVRPGRVVVQRLGLAGDPPRRYLLRVFVDVDRRPPEIVTLYRTSRIEKYRSPS